jgi:hypothetical protein
MDSNSYWNLPFGYQAPRGQIIFFVQVVIAFVVILAAIVNLSVPSLPPTEKEQSYWKVALSATIGYLFPNPRLSIWKRQPEQLASSSSSSTLPTSADDQQQ